MTRETMNLHDVSDFVQAAHAHQHRDDGEKYFSHLFRVKTSLQKFGVTNPVVLATAYCHDLLEDTNVTEEVLLELTCPEVLESVKQLTNKTPGNFAARSNTLLDHAKHFNDVSKRVKLADRYDNVTSVLMSWEPWRVKHYASVGLNLLDVMRPMPDDMVAFYAEAQRLFSCVA